MDAMKSIALIAGLVLAAGGLTQTRGHAQSALPKTGMVAWWQGNGDATDSSGNGHQGTLEGSAGFTTGINGGQAFLAGPGRTVFVPDDPAFYLTSLTMAAWVNPTAVGYLILFRGDERVEMDPYVIGLNASGGFGIAIRDQGNNFAGLSSPTPLTFNTWSHVAATLDDSSGDMRVYVNGALVAETNTVIRPFGALDPSLKPGLGIGNTEGGADFPFLGAISQVFLYSRALSATEIEQLYQFNGCTPHSATATAQVVNGFVVGVTVTDGGCGYTNPPTVLIAGGGGTGAAATAVITNGEVASISITSAGIGYTRTPVIYIGSPGGIQLALTKAVKPTLFNLMPGSNYQLQVSGDSRNWTNQGGVFSATNTSMAYPQYFDVDNFDKLFFRLVAIP